MKEKFHIPEKPNRVETEEKPLARGSERKRLFEPGDLVSTFTGDLGLVLSSEALQQVRALFKEGNHPGRFFAQGCCQNPDYLTQVPVFFEDGTYDVMRAMNIKKKTDLPHSKREELEKRMKARIESNKRRPV